MSIENLIERIAVALETIAGRDQFGPTISNTAVETPKRTRVPKVTKVEDAVPGVEDNGPLPGNPIVEAQAGNAIATGSELRALAQQYIAAAEASDPGGKNGAVNKLVTFIQGVAKIFNPKEPKLIKIPDEKVAEASQMIADWASKNHIKLPVEV
jgi:hypothetical protein